MSTIRTCTVRTRDHGDVVVYAAIDEAGNRRLIPVGASSLEAWRADLSLLSPWLLGVDLADPTAWGRVYRVCEGKEVDPLRESTIVIWRVAAP